MAQTFPGILSFAFLAALLVFGALIRAKVRFFQINLVPASLIGGTLGFGLIALASLSPMIFVMIYGMWIA